MTYATKLLSPSEEDIAAAAEMLKNGEVVGIPTETVYGLAANALNETAVAKIFAAKGRPADNPLIVHISRFEDIYNYAEYVPENAKLLAELFWPGPMTMILRKKECIPYITSGGLDTVGLRFPANITARRIIDKCGFPLAAPSANLSGSPSPTSAVHVMDDMQGRISAVVDGGSCEVGVESTVISVSDEGKVCLLRPGFITLEELTEAVEEDNVTVAKGVTECVSDGERVLSPGMKYKHYSPKANVTVVKGDIDSFSDYIAAHGGDNCAAMVFDGDEDKCPCRCISYGSTGEQQAQRLFSLLRKADEKGIDQIYVRCPEQSGVGLAVYNRLLRAAGFEVISL